MKLYRFIFLLLAVVLLSGCAYHDMPVDADFRFKHSKAQKCDEYWLTFNRLVKNADATCDELLQIDGFPYLRGTRPLVEDGLQLEDRKAFARWLEMMRSADMQARYHELDALRDKDWAVLCSEANIYNCEAGRLRAFTARCSALLLGDERTNPDFPIVLKEAATAALKREYPHGRACFKNRQTLDGTIPADIPKALSSPSSSYRGGSVLEQRVNRVRSMSTGIPGRK